MTCWHLPTSVALSASTTSWERVEYYQLSVLWSSYSQTGVPTSGTTMNIPVTFANAGNQKRLMLGGFCPTVIGAGLTFTIVLQEFVGGTTWTTRTTDNFTITSGSHPDMYGNYVFDLTSYAVTTGASLWRYVFTKSGTGTIGVLYSSAVPGGYTVAAICDAATGKPATGDLAIIGQGITLTFDESLSLGHSGNVSMVMTYNSTVDWSSPATTYTLTLLGSIFAGKTFGFPIGTVGTPISVAKQAVIDFTGAAANLPLFNIPGIYQGNATNAMGATIPTWYGVYSANIYSTLDADAASGQKVVVTKEDMSASWVAGDTLGLYGAEGQVSTTIWTIAAGGVSGKNITLTTNLDFKYIVGSRIINLSEKRNFGIVVKQDNARHGYLFYGTSSSARVQGTTVLSGIYLENMSPMNVAMDGSSTGANITLQNILNYTVLAGGTRVFVANNVSGGILTISNVHQLANNSNAGFGIVATLLKGLTVTNSSILGTYNGGSLAATLSLTSCVNVTLTGSQFYNTYSRANANYNNTVFVNVFNTSATDCVFHGGYSLTLGGGVGTFTNCKFAWMANGFVFNSIVGYNFIGCDLFSTSVASTYDFYINSDNYAQVLFTNCLVGSIAPANLANTINGTYLRFDTYNQTANDHRGFLTYGNIVSTATGLADSTRHTATGIGMRFQPTHSTNPLVWTFNVPTGNIATYPITVNDFIKINNATYYAGTHTKPTLSVLYDKVTTSTSVATGSTAWQESSVQVTPTTAYGQIVVSISGATDATGTNAYFYLDDMEFDYPIGYSANLATLDLWADAIPITPASDTTGVSSYEWTDDPYVVASEATASAYTGIALNYSTKVIAISEDHSITQLYEYCKASSRALGVINALSTTDGVTFNLAGGWTIDITASNIDLTGIGNINLQGTTVLAEPGFTSSPAFANGTVEFDTAGTYDVNFSSLFGTITADFTSAGTYNLTATDVDGTLHVDSSNDSTVTVVLSPSASVTNDNPTYVTVDNALSVDVEITDIVEGSQCRVIETVSGDELANETVGPTGIVDFSYVWTTDVDISILVRKSSAATKYLEWGAGGTITNVGLNVQVTQVIDANANATTHANWAEWTIDGSAKTITHSSGSTIFTTNELYTGLQDWADASGTMQYVNPMTCNVKNQSYTLGTGWTLATNSEKYLKTGGLQTSDAGVIYTNIYTTDTLVASSEVYIVQNGTEITAWWSGNPIDVLIKVKTGGSLIDSGELEFYTRKYATLYDYQLVDASAGGRQVVVLANFTDTNNATASGTVAGYSDITVTVANGNYDIGDGDGVQPYNGVVDGAGRTVAQVYEYLKYLTRDGSTTDFDGVQGQYFRYLDVTYSEIEGSPVASKAGDSIFFAQGWFFTDMASADALNYQLIDANGVTRTPPTPPTTISITNIVDGSRLQIYNVTTDAELFNDIITGTTKDYVYTPGAGDETIRVRLTSVGASSAYLFYEANITANSSGGSLVAAQVEDTVYAENGIDGSGITSCSVTGTTIKVFVDEADNAIDIQDIYNWYCYMLFTESGIRDQGWNLRAVDSTNYKTYNSLLIHNDGGSALLLGGGYILPATGGTVLDIYDTTGDPIFLGYNHAVGLAGGSSSGAGEMKYIVDGEIPIY